MEKRKKQSETKGVGDAQKNRTKEETKEQIKTMWSITMGFAYTFPNRTCLTHKNSCFEHF